MQKDNIVILRVIATIMVVTFHSLGCYTYGWSFCSTKIMAYEYFDIFINHINMPLFVSISGYLFGCGLIDGKYVSTKSFIKQKVKHLLVPYVVWSLFQLAIFPQTVQLSMIWTGCLHLWFLLMLFFIFLFVILLKPIWGKFSAKSLSIIVIVLPLITSFVQLKSFLCLDNIVNYMVFFVAGMLLSKDNFFSGRRLSSYLAFIGIILLCGVTFMVGRSSEWYALIAYGYCSLLTVYCLLSATKDIQISICKSSLVQSLNKCSMGIYIIHHIIIWAIVQNNMIHEYLENHYIISPFLMFICSLILSWGLTIFILRHQNNSYIIG